MYQIGEIISMYMSHDWDKILFYVKIESCCKLKFMFQNERNQFSFCQKKTDKMNQITSKFPIFSSDRERKTSSNCMYYVRTFILIKAKKK